MVNVFAKLGKLSQIWWRWHCQQRHFINGVEQCGQNNDPRQFCQQTTRSQVSKSFNFWVNVHISNFIWFEISVWEMCHLTMPRKRWQVLIDKLESRRLQLKCVNARQVTAASLASHVLPVIKSPNWASWWINARNKVDEFLLIIN